MQKNWIETHFENRHAALSRNVTKINCPFCEKPIENSEVTKKREKCKECKKDFCYNCMKEWDCKFVNSTDIHHCIENTYKGKEKFQAEKKIKELKIFEEEYQKFIREKIKNEEELKKINDNIETKLDKIKKNDKEYINDFMWLQDGINGFFLLIMYSLSFKKKLAIVCFWGKVLQTRFQKKRKRKKF